MSKEKPIFITYIAKPIYKTFYLNPRFKIKKEDGGVLDKIKGPAIIIGNHTHILDVVFAYASIKPHVRWVAGAYLFKKRFTRFLFKDLAKCIPKQQGRSDLKTIRNISAALKEGSIVGLFPEGTRTWDGNSIDINHKATAKMLKIFKVPVYFLSFEGTYDLHPRWADSPRRGSIVIRLKKVLTSEELNTLPLDELMKITQDGLYFNHEDWQKKVRKPFYSKEGALGIQRLLYICPVCHHPQTINGKNNTVSCSHCHTEDVLTEYLDFKENNFGFKTLPKWNKFQKDYLRENKVKFIGDKGDFFRKGVDDHFEMISTDFSCLLEDENIVFSLADDKKYSFELSKIDNMVLSVKQSVEFYHENQLYSFRLQPKLNSLKYFQKWEVSHNA